VVYCGGLENRFRRKPDGGSNPSLSASLRWNEVGARPPRRSMAKAGENEKCFELRLGKLEKIVSYTEILILAVVIGGIFGLLWWQGQIRRLVTYWQEMMAELEKCSRPSWEELKGSTALVIVSIGLLGAFTVAVDFFMNLVFIKL
jgi:preprotein translocase SecE subunit